MTTHCPAATAKSRWPDFSGAQSDAHRRHLRMILIVRRAILIVNIPIVRMGKRTADILERFGQRHDAGVARDRQHQQRQEHAQPHRRALSVPTKALTVEFDAFADMLGSAPAVAEAQRRARQLARARVPVLILGETGAGKELFARALHLAGPRRNTPFSY